LIDIQVLASSSRGNCYRISDSVTPLLLEAGIPFKEIQKKLLFKTSEIVGCLISHEHQDHAKSVQDVTRAGIDCYMSKGTAEALKVSGHRIKVVEDRKLFDVGSWTILPFKTEHDAEEPLGFLLANKAGDKLVFITDLPYCRYRFTGITHFMVEVNYVRKILDENVKSGSVPLAMKKRLMHSHMSLETAVDFFKANDLSKANSIWLIHLSGSNSDEALIKKTIQEISGKPVYIAQRG
jgi:phosphoribosyl 1,2-cyclic phosphodiesterase